MRECTILEILASCVHSVTGLQPKLQDLDTFEFRLYKRGLLKIYPLAVQICQSVALSRILASVHSSAYLHSHSPVARSTQGGKNMLHK